MRTTIGLWVLGAIVFGALLLTGCSEPETGTLAINANGEDFVRQGFTTKDGWDIAFDAVYVTISDVKAYQTDPPYDAASGVLPQSETQVGMPAVTTVDLAAGDAFADPVLLAMIDDAPAGQYNALSWQMVNAAEGPSEDATVTLLGTATKDNNTIVFDIAVNESFQFSCGEYVGDSRKGILAADDSADLELTFHFDHIFGDGTVPLDDGLNVGALGFEPLAALAENGVLDVDSAELQAGLSAEAYHLFFNAVATLGHVGEGHCYEATGGYTGQES
jgi:hypothetical protein